MEMSPCKQQMAHNNRQHTNRSTTEGDNVARLKAHHLKFFMVFLDRGNQGMVGPAKNESTNAWCGECIGLEAALIESCEFKRAWH